MSASFAVRPAKLEDLPNVFALQRAIKEAPDWSQAAYRDFVELPPDALQRKALLVADSGAIVNGFAAVSALRDEAELQSIAVAVGSRRLGLGRALLAAVVKWAADGGSEVLRLEVRSANATARAFYERQGFRQVGLRRRYYRNPDDDGVLMSLGVRQARTFS